MRKTDFVRARIEPGLKMIAENVLNELGITPTQAINMPYRRIARDHEWLLELKIPNQMTRLVLDETDKDIDLTPVSDCDDLFRQLGI